MMKELFIPYHETKREILHYRDTNGDKWIRKQNISQGEVSMITELLSACETQYDIHKAMEQILRDYGVNVEAGPEAWGKPAKKRGKC